MGRWKSGDHFAVCHQNDMFSGQQNVPDKLRTLVNIISFYHKN
jgi:hypothetical protein